MKLYQIPNGSKLRVTINDEKAPRSAIFHHIDGMYSLCTIDDLPEGENSFHLSAMEEMKLVDGHYEIDSK